MGAGHGHWTVFCSILPFFLNYTFIVLVRRLCCAYDSEA